MRSRAGRHWALATMPVAVVVAALVIPLTGLGRYFRCSRLCFFYGIRSALVITYLFITEAAKRVFYAHRALTQR